MVEIDIRSQEMSEKCTKNVNKLKERCFQAKIVTGLEEGKQKKNKGVKPIKLYEL